MISEFPDHLAPKVARYRGKVALLTPDEAEGFLMSAAAAVTVAARLLGAVADVEGRETFSLPVQGIELTGAALLDGDAHGRLVLTIEGAPIAVHLTATQIAELAAGFTAAARALDTPGAPRRDG